jgi:hypothetical protein
MEPENTPPSQSKVALWVSYVMSAIPVLMLFMSAGMKISKAKALRRWVFPQA